MTVFVRSLLIFATVPMEAARSIKPKAVEKWERELLRKMHLLLRDLDGRLIANLVRATEPS